MDIYSCLEKATISQIITPRENISWYSNNEKSGSWQDFDYLPIGDPITGTIEAIFETKYNKIIPFDPTWVIPINTRIIDLPFKFLNNQHQTLFVENSITCGVVSISDLNKGHVRIILYSLFMELEILITSFVRSTYGDSIIYSKGISATRRDKILDNFSVQKREKIETDIFACLNLTDLTKIIKEKDELREFFSFPSKNQAQIKLGGLVSLRNCVAHPSRLILSKRQDLKYLPEKIEKINNLLKVLRNQKLEVPRHNSLALS